MIGILVGLSILAALTKIWIGFDVDEGYAVVLPYRLLQKDHLFLDLWEIHQTSAILPALLLLPFHLVTQDPTGSVLYLRVVATILHTLMTFVLYKFMLKDLIKDQFVKQIIALLYYNFLPKWMMSIDFSMQYTWFFMLVVVFFYQGRKTGHKFNYFAMGIALALLVLAYPTMLLLFVVLIAFMVMQKESKSNMFSFLLGCVGLGLVFIMGMISQIGLNKWMNSIPHLLKDGSHQYDLSHRVGVVLAQWKSAFVEMGILLIPAIITVIIVYCINRMRTTKQTTVKNIKTMRLSFVFWGVMVLAPSVIVIVANVVGIDWGPFRLQARYLTIAVWGLVEGIWLKKWRETILLLTGFLAVIIASNVGPVSSSSYLVLSIMATFYIIYSNYLDSSDLEAIAFKGILTVFVLSLIFCKGYYVRVSEYPPANILESRDVITSGGAKGIYVYEQDAQRLSSANQMIHSSSHEEEQLLFMGTEGILNLATKGHFVSPTTISTPAFNEQWVLYFKEHPNKVPTKIIIAKNTIDDTDKFFTKNPFGIWIREQYDLEHAIENVDYYIIER